MGFFKLIVIIFSACVILFNYSNSFSKIQNNNFYVATNEDETQSTPVDSAPNSDPIPEKKPKAKTQTTGSFNANSKTVIKAKTINVKRKSNQIEFNEDAVAENGDTSILADKMVVFYNDKDKDNTEIKDIEATGNVKIFNEEFVATGDTGSYDPKKQVFVIKQNVVFNNGTSIANGDKFIYDLRTKKGYLTGGDESKGRKAPTKSLKGNRVTIIMNEYNE